MLAHQRLQIGPDRVRPLGQDPVLLVQDLVEDRDALVGQAHLVRVRIAQAPADIDRVPVLTCEFSSPPTYWIGLLTRASSGSRRGKTEAGASALVRVMTGPA